MGNVNGEWIMLGCDADDPYRLHTPEEAIDYINKIGFLPLFAGSIPGFSLEERTLGGYWWSGDVERDPWEWRRIIAASEKVAYGKFFAGKAGFVSLDWLPYFANMRRDGYDFDALWDEGKAKRRAKLIMDQFADNDEFDSASLKRASGLVKGESKYFDPIVNELQMMTYLVIKDFRQKINKHGQPYGWHIAVYSTPEKLWGEKLVRSAYSEEPEVSRKRIYDFLQSEYPIASQQQLKALIK